MQMDFTQTILLEKGMRTQQASIPKEAQRTECEGMGQISVGCALTHSIYATCPACEGSGRKEVQERHEQLQKHFEKLRAKHSLPS